MQNKPSKCVFSTDNINMPNKEQKDIKQNKPSKCVFSNIKSDNSDNSNIKKPSKCVFDIPIKEQKKDEPKQQLKPVFNFPSKEKKYTQNFVKTNFQIPNPTSISINKYEYPNETIYNFKQFKKQKYEPFGTQWIHDEQVDDNLNKEILRKTEIVKQLMAIDYPAQRSEQWFLKRDGAITASDGGCVVNENHYELPYKFILKKLGKAPFVNNEHCYHGKKYESIATMVYEYRCNVKVEEFGLVIHPKYSFLAASPDGIVGLYKADRKHLTQYTGRMVEIKCPVTRKIKTEGNIKGDICPDYYWVQVQLQLECCNLDECDFWQCEITQYQTRQDFIDDTDVLEPFRSKTTGMEKGAVIQLLPKNKYKDFVDESGKNDIYMYNQIMYEHAKIIYPPKIEMTPYEYDMWIAETMQEINNNYPEYSFDRIFYWKFEKTHCTTIYRDVEWFKVHLPILTKMWDYVLFLRQNKDKAELICNYIDSMTKPKTKSKFNIVSEKTNEKIMKVIDNICCVPDNKSAKNKYDIMLNNLEDEIKENNKKYS